MNDSENRLIVGSRRPDGTFNLSKAAFVDRTENREVPQPTELPLPPNWTYLMHGSNLDKPEWQGEGGKQLDENVLEVKGMGLSVIDKESRDENLRTVQKMRASGQKVGSFDTTSQYARGAGTPLEIRVVFPTFNSREQLQPAAKLVLIEKHGEELVNAIFDLADQVHWKNHQSGRHPLLPRGMKLTKLVDENVSGRGRVIQYVPEVLESFYKQELANS